MTRVVTRTFAGVAGLAIALTGTALPAFAADAPDVSSRVSLFGAGSLAPSGVDATSAYFAGYEKDPDGALKSASAKTTVPDVSCSGSALKGSFQGIGNEQEEGVPTLLAGVFVVCDGSTPIYQLAALSGAVSNASTGAVSPGDKLTVSLTAKKGNITMKVVNTTTDEIVTAKDAGVDTVAQYGSFPLFDSGTGEKLPVPNFGKETFSANKLNGDQLADATKYVRKAGSNVQIDTGKLAKGKFALTYKHA